MNYIFYPTLESAIIPIHINFIKNSLKMSDVFLSGEFIEKLYNNIEQSSQTHFILDFEYIFYSSSYAFERFAELKGKHLIILNLESEKFHNALKAECPLLTEGDYNRNILSDKEGMSFYTSNLSFIQSSKKYHLDKLINKCLEREKDEYYISSSNIFGNSYFDLKKIFYNPIDSLFIAYELATLIKKKYNSLTSDRKNNSHKKVKLLCSSFNGAVLATMVGKLLDLSVLYIMKLGPDISLRDKELINEINVNDEFFYIADMSCLGTEFKLTKTIIKLLGADIVGSALVVKYIDPDNNNKLDSLVEFVDGDDFNYKLTIRKK